MACQYCYAKGGAYGNRTRQDLDRRTALQALLWASRNYGRVRHIQFFGGEPTLSLGTIDAVCDFAGYLADHQNLPGPRTFGLTTNGLDLNQNVLETIERHRLQVTVSVDGPPEIHDRLRPQRDGAPSFARIAKGIRSLRSLGIEPEIECTYTQLHLRAGLSILDLLAFFEGQFQSRLIHCPTVVAPRESPWFVDLQEVIQPYAEAVRASVVRLAEGKSVISMTARWIDDLARRHPNSCFCPAGRTALTVATDGAVFPCFMFIPRREARVGNVRCGIPRATPWVQGLIDSSATSTNVECGQCWMQPLCFGCLGDELLRGEGLFRRSARPGQALGCDFRRALADALLEGFADLGTTGFAGDPA